MTITVCRTIAELRDALAAPLAAPALALVAATVGGVRLIDNAVLRAA